MEIRLVICDLDNKDKLKILVEKEKETPPSNFDSLCKAFQAGRVCYCETEYGLNWVTQKEKEANQYRTLITVPSNILEEVLQEKNELSHMFPVSDDR